MDGSESVLYSSVYRDSDSDPGLGNQSDDSDQSWLDQLQLASELEHEISKDGGLVEPTVQTTTNPILEIGFNTSLKRLEGWAQGVQRGSSRGNYKKKAKLADPSEEPDATYSTSRAGSKRGSYKPRDKPAVHSEETDGVISASRPGSGKRGSYKPRDKPADRSEETDGAMFASRACGKRGRYKQRAEPTTRAQKVATKFKDNLSFLTCACCPFAGPQHLFLSIEDFRKTNNRRHLRSPKKPNKNLKSAQN